MNKNELIMLQALPLEVKILKTMLRIREYVDYYGIDGVYICFSGGKDSTVLVHIARQMYPNIKVVFSNTGLEFPEVVQFVNTIPNVVTVRPQRTFRRVLEEKGYPVVSKKVSMMIKRIQAPAHKNVYCRRIFLEGIKMDGTPASRASLLPYKWRYLLDAPFKISDECCKYLKKDPLKWFERQNGVVPIVATMAQESDARCISYLKTGCNSFNRDAMSRPMGFWTEQDVLHYIVKYNVKIASVYGKVVINRYGEFETTGERRTGCIFCCLGVQYEEGENRFQRLERTHPKLHEYCMEELGFKEVLNYMGVPYSAPIEVEARESA